MTGIMLPRKPTEKEIRKDEREKVLDELDLLIPLCDAIINKFDSHSQLGFNALLLKRKYEALRQEGMVEKQ